MRCLKFSWYSIRYTGLHRKTENPEHIFYLTRHRWWFIGILNWESSKYIFIYFNRFLYFLYVFWITFKFIKKNYCMIANCKYFPLFMLIKKNNIFFVGIVVLLSPSSHAISLLMSVSYKIGSVGVQFTLFTFLRM